MKTAFALCVAPLRFLSYFLLSVSSRTFRASISVKIPMSSFPSTTGRLPNFLLDQDGDRLHQGSRLVHGEGLAGHDAGNGGILHQLLELALVDALEDRGGGSLDVAVRDQPHQELSGGDGQVADVMAPEEEHRFLHARVLFDGNRIPCHVVADSHGWASLRLW